MDWIEVAVRGVDGEAAEALTEVMNRFGHGGAVIEQIVGSEDGAYAVDGPLVVKTYIADGVSAGQTIDALREALWHLNVIYPMPEPEIKRLAHDDWSQAWKQHYSRSKPGERIVIVPAWEEPGDDPDELPVRIDPGMAFGTGTHPSTQLCIQLLERHLKAGDSLFDVGVGSGILSIAACRMGATPVVGSDLDPVAVEATKENARLNGLEEEISVREGSVDAFDGPFDVIVINILAEVIVLLLPQANVRLAPGGRIILSGIIAEREPLVMEVVELLSLRLVERLELGDWVGLCVTPVEEERREG